MREPQRPDPEGQPPCFHGGAFFAAIGEEFDTLPRHEEIINADVLDAWFPPAPGVLEELQEHLAWLLRTSPPTHCGGLIRVLARSRGVEEACLLPGAGSSALMFLAFSQWLTAQDRVLILDPTYGEYAHILERVIGCRVQRFPLAREEGYRPDLEQLLGSVKRGVKFVVIVNPNSPTGVHLPAAELEAWLKAVPPGTRVWIDETYVEYAGNGQSLESFAARSDNTVVCKSMSKVYALSGARVAYLCAGPRLLRSLRPLVPPWAVSGPAQVAAVRALQDPDYYAERYAETHALRDALVTRLARLAPLTITPSVANFILCELDATGPTAAEVVARCREDGVFLRDASSMGSDESDHALRIAVKDEASNRRILEVLGPALSR